MIINNIKILEIDSTIRENQIFKHGNDELMIPLYEYKGLAETLQDLANLMKTAEREKGQTFLTIMIDEPRKKIGMAMSEYELTYDR